MINSVLITGVQGLLGSHLANQLELLGYSIYGLGRKKKANTKISINLSVIDLASNWTIEELPRQCDAIIHLAQSASFRDFPNSALDVFKVNIESTARLLDYAKHAGVKKFIYASSGGVYGNSNRAIKENEPIVPPGQLGYYLGSKACSEILVQSYASVFQVIVIRPFFIYGPGQNRSMLIPRLFDSVANGNPISLQGADGIRINPIHVEDAATAITASLNYYKCATFNIAGPDVLSIRQICSEMGHYIGCDPIFRPEEGVPKDLIGDNSAMCEQLIAPKRHLFRCLSDIEIYEELD